MNDRLLTRYVAGECTADEKRRVEHWAARDPRHQARLDELRVLWEAAEKPSRSWDVEAAWSRTARRFEETQQSDASEDRPSRRRARRSGSHRTRSYHALLMRRVLPVVAVLTVVAFAYWLQEAGVDDTEPGREAVETRQIATQRAERKRIRLADSTAVHLNADSEIRYPASFGSERREVHLSGEAYFEVASDSARPFIVTTELATTRVLGTAFTVTSYDDATTTQVVVREGRVEVAPADRSDQLVIGAGQWGRVDASGRLSYHQPATVHHHFSWIDSQLSFQEQPLDEVARRLERWYDIEVCIADPEIAQRRLTATFERESLSEALDALSLALQVQYEHERGRVIFYADTLDAATCH